MKRRTGAVYLPWLFILLMIGSLIWLMNRLSVGIQHADVCEARLEKLYEHIRIYEQEQGRLPTLELYPEDLFENPESLLNLLKEQPGFNPEWLICPSSPPVLRERGITYLWNTALNQSSLTNRKEITWVLVDIQALDDSITGPHFGNYHILYTDGRVESSSTPPHSLPVQF
ncbi:MAG: hypothetical protein WD708_02605 [Kiritimatiellia bacterium]